MFKSMSLGGLSWTELAKRVYAEVMDDDVLGRSAQLSYYFLLALFPALLFLTSLLGYLAGENGELREGLFNYLATVLPGDASKLVSETVSDVTESSGGGKLSFGILATLWAASNGMGAISESLNAAYDLKETRPWWKVRLTAVGLTGSGISARRLVRAARSLRAVTPASSVPLEEFLSSDGSIWCRIGRYDPADRFCVSHGGADEYGAAVLLDGTVHLCGAGQADPYAECTQTWNPYALRLRDGLSSDFGGYLCTEQAGAMTCTVKDGPGQGSGFRVSAAGSQAVAGVP